MIMNKRGLTGMGLIVVLTLFAGVLHGQSDLCLQVDMKPVLSLQQVNQAELVHYMVQIAIPERDRPSPEGKTPEEFYDDQVQLLVENGYPPVLSEVEPDRLVTRRYFASVMFQLAMLVDDDFARRYAGVTDETEQLNALVQSEWIYAAEGRMYREEILSVLCTHDLGVPPPPIDVEIFPEEIEEANLEAPKSPL